MNAPDPAGTFRDSVESLLGMTLTPRQIRDFETYEALLLEWNQRVNLTAITKGGDVRIKHFLDSLSCLKAISDRPGLRVVDVGTGAGFPGVPVKIALPGIRLTLVESTGKKADFCRLLVDRLALRDVTVLTARAEDVGRDPAHRETYHWALARAVAELAILAEYLLPLVEVGGRMLAQKGESGPAEAHAASKALHLLGGAVAKIEPVELPGIAEPRYLIVVRKTAATPAQYPRRTGVPSKRPLGGTVHTAGRKDNGNKS